MNSITHDSGKGFVSQRLSLGNLLFSTLERDVLEHPLPT